MLWRPEGEGRARAGGRAGCGPGRPRSAEGRREGARRSLLLAHWLPPSAGGLVSQSARSRRKPESRRGLEPWTPAPPPAIVPPAAAASGGGRGALVPVAPVRRGGGSVRAGRREAGRGAVPEGTVLAAAVAPQPLCLQPAAGPGPGAVAARPASDARGCGAAGGPRRP